MLLSACILVRDGAAFISRTIRSAKRIADEVLVADTGSFDNSIQLARDLGARVFSSGWNHDFSLARNFLLNRARGEWVLFLDADEEISNDYHQLRLLLKNSDDEGYYLPVIDTGTERETEMIKLVLRLFRNRPEYNFKGRINERITESILKQITGVSLKLIHLPIIHYSAEICNKPDTGKFLLTLHPSLAAKPEFNDISLLKIFRQACNYLEQKRYRLALNELELGYENSCGQDRLIFQKIIPFALLSVGNYLQFKLFMEEADTNYDPLLDFWQGIYALQMRNYLKAEGLFHRFLKNMKQGEEFSNNALLFLGIIYIKRGELKAAADCLKGIDLSSEKGLDKLKLIFRESINYLDPVLLLDLLPERSEQAYLLLLDLLLKGHYYQKALTILEQDRDILRKNNEGKLLCAQLLLHLKKYNRAEEKLKEITPDYEKYEQVLDLLWIIGLIKKPLSETRGVLNQIKLLGNEHSWRILKLYNRIYFDYEEIWLNFNSLAVKYKFYRKCLYYLGLLVEFGGEDQIDPMLEIVKSLQMTDFNGDLGRIFYQNQLWEKAAYYFRINLSRGDNLSELYYLADIEFKLENYQQAAELYENILLLDEFSYTAYNRLVLINLLEEVQMITDLLHWKKDRGLQQRLTALKKILSELQEVD